MVSMVPFNKFKHFVFLGLPGSGKGTFADIICKRFNWFHLSLGDIVREKSRKDKAILEISSRGLLLPDAIVNEIVFEALENTSADVILDGYPRTSSQAMQYIEFCRKHVIETRAIHIDLDVEVVKAKLLGRRQCSTCKQSFNVAGVMHSGYDMPPILPDPDTCIKGKVNCNPVMTSRLDDIPEIIEKRIQVFQSETQPLIDYFSAQNRLVPFVVKKGIKDTDDLIKAMTSSLR